MTRVCVCEMFFYIKMHASKRSGQAVPDPTGDLAVLLMSLNWIRGSDSGLRKEEGKERQGSDRKEKEVNSVNLGEGARHFCPKIYVRKMPEFYMIFIRKILFPEFGEGQIPTPAAPAVFYRHVYATVIWCLAALDNVDECAGACSVKF